MKKGFKKGSGVAVLVGGRFNSKVIYDPYILKLQCWEIAYFRGLQGSELFGGDPTRLLPIRRFKYFSTEQLDKFGRRIYEYENMRVGTLWGVRPEYKQNKEVCQLMWKSNRLRHEIERKGIDLTSPALTVLNNELNQINKRLWDIAKNERN